MSRQLQLSNASWLHFFHSSEFQRTSTQSHELRTFLGEKEIATSRTSYNPEDIKITVKLRSTTVWYGKQSAIGHWIPRIRQQSTGKMLSRKFYIPFGLSYAQQPMRHRTSDSPVFHEDHLLAPASRLGWPPLVQSSSSVMSVPARQGPLVDEIELLQANPQ